MSVSSAIAATLAGLSDHPDHAASVSRLLSELRAHLRLDVLCLSQDRGGKSLLQVLDAAPGDELGRIIRTGACGDDYGARAQWGDLPCLIPDTAALPPAERPTSAQAQVRAFIGVPVYSQHGAPYGMLWGFAHAPRPDLNDRDLAVMTAFATLAGALLGRAKGEVATDEATTQRLRATIENRQFDIAFQPILDLLTGEMRGVEALSRFHGPPAQGPLGWIAEAANHGLQAELEATILSHALELREDLPRGLYMSVNVSPATLVSTELHEALAGHDTLGLILELTDYIAIPCEAALERAITHLRCRGVKLAIDDVGSGYSGLSKILRFRPDYLKLDMSLVSGLETDAAKRSLALAMQHFAREIGAKLIAVGVEREEEAYALRMLGITLAQGFHLGRPGPLAALARGSAA